MRPPESTPIRYTLVGGINTLVGLSAIYAAKWLLGMNDVLANLLGYAVGFALSFALNQRWTFRFRGAALPALGRFLLVQVAAYLSNLATVLLLITAGTDSYLAQAAGVLPYTLIGYIGSRCFAFAAAAPDKTP